MGNARSGRATLRPAQLAVVAVAVAALVLAACSGGAKAKISAAAGTTTTTDPQAAYRTCLAQHGVNLPADATAGGAGRRAGGQRPTTTTVPGAPPDTNRAGGGRQGGFGGGGAPAGVDPSTFQAARTACRDLLPAGAGGGPGGGQNSQAFQAYASCMRDHGVDVGNRFGGGNGPSTTNGSGPPTTSAGGPPPSIDRNSPAFQAANQTCSVLLPSPDASTTTSVPSK